MCLYSLKPSEVFLNPFFWDWKKRLDFLADVDEVVDENKCNLFRELYKLGTQVFLGANGWQETVDKKWLERMRCWRSHGFKRDRYGDHLPGFLKLVRNTYIHILGHFHDPFEREDLDWFLRQRYPNLFPVVHRAVEENEKCRKHRLLKYYYFVENDSD